MALKRLSEDVKSLLKCSSYINCYKRAIEELVYNALDACATSIAVRVNFEENSFQIIDNGVGVTECDINNIGLEYMTSKCIDVSNFKSVPDNYGYQGKALASIINVSQKVKFISRHESTTKTWVKIFYNGKQSAISQDNDRPSKGTTVQVNGFLYNLHIQSKLVNKLQEMQDLKLFLEQLSLVHSNVSLSLRNDTNNEIIFQIHKSRDINQTLQIVFGIERNNLQELTIQKNNYKTIAYIGKGIHIHNEQHWIFLNGRYLSHCKLHKIINTNLIKCLNLGDKNETIKKKIPCLTKNYGHITSKKNIPFYMVFITCPYDNYDMNLMPKTCLIEFYDWEPITKLLEKLVKFYVGDLKLKDVNKSVNANVIVNNNDDTRDKVRQIMQKFLGSASRNPKIAVSQMHNGIKGKIAKRKQNKKKELKKVITTPEIVANIVAKPLQNSSIEKPMDENINLNIQNYSYKVKKKNKIKHVKNKKKCKDLAALFENPTKSLKDKCEITSNSIKILFKQRYKKMIHDIKRSNENISIKQKVRNSQIPFSQAFEQLNKFENNLNKCCKNLGESHHSKRFKSREDLFETILKTQKKLKHKFNVKSDFDNNYMELMYKTKSSKQIYQHNKPHVHLNSKLTYESHICCENRSTLKKDRLDVSHNVIRKQYQDNLITKIKKNYKQATTYSYKGQDKDTATNYTGYNFNKYVSNSNITQITNQNSIGYSNYDYESNFNQFNNSTYQNHDYFIHDSKVPNDIINKLTLHIKSQNSEMFFDNFREYAKRNITSTINFPGKINYNFRRLSRCDVDYSTSSSIKPVNDNAHPKNNNSNNTNVLFISKSLPKVINIDKNDFIEPLDICEVVMKSNDIFEEDSCHNLIKETSCSNNCHQNNGDNFSNIMHTSEYVNNLNFTYTLIPNIHGKSLSNARNVEFNNEKGFVQDINTITIENNSIVNYNQQQYQDNMSDCLLIENPQRNDKRHLDSSPNFDFSNDNGLTQDLNNVSTKNNNQLYGQQSNGILVENKRKDKRNMSSTQNFELNNKKGFTQNLNIPKINNNSILYNKTQNVISDRLLIENSTRYNINNELNELENVSQAVTNASPIMASKEHIRSSNSKELFNTDNQVYSLEKEIPLKNKDIDENLFCITDRLQFVPKGLSPIFLNCNTKSYNKNVNNNTDYFADSLYKDFQKGVEVNSEVFKSKIHNIREFTTAEIDRVISKIRKNTASIIFDETSLKYAEVLKQVDNKFIAAKLRGKNLNTSETSEYLVLFDQHAVHERINLESNLKYYLVNNQWKTVYLDNFRLTLSNEECLYLHNYKDKFSQFGLQWTSLNGVDISIKAIPEAILGKNIRNVDVVISAVKNLIQELVKNIKDQSGSVSLYPHTLIDLVSSEACRYAIKFGDPLTKCQCSELINSLHNCKTAFQCAHGRPALAVLLHLKSTDNDYKVNPVRMKMFIDDRTVSKNYKVMN